MAENNQAQTLKGSLILLVTAFIWGIAFAFQKQAMDFIGPFMFEFIRFLFGTITIIFILLVMKIFSKNKSNEKLWNKRVLIGGLITGVILFAGSGLQQISLTMITASKAGFITSLYIILVPIIGIFLKHKTGWNVWLGVFIALPGLYFLSIKSDFSIEMGDTILIISAFLWATHILVTDNRVNGLSGNQIFAMCGFQFFITSVLSCIAMIFFDINFVTEMPGISDIMDTIFPLLYVGVFSSGVAFTTQAIGQKYTPPGIAALIMSLEAVFGVLGAFVLLGERLSFKETVGCILMFIAIIMVELPVKKKAK